MKKAYIYLTLAVMAVLGTACSKNSAIDGPEPDSTYKIGFGKIAVKAADDPTSNPLQLRIYDYFTPTGGTETEYINDLLQQGVSADATVEAPWEFVESGKPNSYNWKEGHHQFFGWVSTDENGVTPTTLSYANKVLTVAAGTVLPGTDNFDYRYSVNTPVDWTSALEDTPVELTVKHLSSALTYSFTNDSDDTSYELTGVKVNGIVKSAGATVTYGEKDEVVAITPGTKGDVDLLADGAMTMVWPQTLEGATLTVDYNVTEDNATVSKKAVIGIPDVDWESGMVYNFNIDVVNKSLSLTFTVLPWDSVDMEMDTEKGSINMSNVMWMNSKVVVDGTEVNTVVNDDKLVTMYYHPIVNGEEYTLNNGYFPAQGFFTVNYPLAGKFFMGVKPAYGQTEVDEDAYEIYVYDASTKSFRLMDNEKGETISRTTVYFQVHATGIDNAEHKAQINIWFIPDGGTEKISAYSEVRATYTLLIPAHS